jgi:hypothetical protein
MRSTLLVVAVFAGASAAQAQLPSPLTLELRPNVGALIQTGAQRDLFDNAALFGLQASWEIIPAIHMVASGAWSPGHHKFAANDDAVNTFLYDLGAEFNLIADLGADWQMKPFLGLGAGGRTYSYHEETFDMQTGFSAYGALGTEFQYRGVAFRMEGRDYVQRFPYPDRNVTRTRNDVGLTAGIAFHVGG